MCLVAKDPSEKIEKDNIKSIISSISRFFNLINSFGTIEIIYW